MNLIEYIEKFVELNFGRCPDPQGVLNDFIEHMSDGVHKGAYVHRTARNLLTAYKAGRSVEDLNYYGK